MAPDSEILGAFSATDLFRGLNRRALEKVAAAAHKSQHPAGKELATQGQGGVGFHLILEGTATVSINGLPALQLARGDYFGEISLIDGLPRSATVTADTDVTTLGLTSWEFRPLLDQEPTLAKELLLVMCARLRQAEQARSAVS